MKARMLTCALSAMLSMFVNVGSDAYGMIKEVESERLMSSDTCNPIDPALMSASEWGEEGAKVLRHKQTINPEVRVIFDKSFKDFNQLQPSGDGAHKWKNFSLYFTQKLLSADIPYTRRFREHCGKHTWRTSLQEIEEALRKGKFFIKPNWMFDASISTALLVSKNAPEDMILFLFCLCEPELKFDPMHNSISVELTNQFSLKELDKRYWTHLVYMLGAPDTPLTEGDMHIIPQTAVNEARIKGGASLTWSSEEARAPGSLYVQADLTIDLTKILPTRELAMFSAMLALKNTFVAQHFTKDQLKEAFCFLKTCQTYGITSEAYIQTLEELKRQLGEDSNTLDIAIPDALVPVADALVFRSLHSETVSTLNQSFDLGSWLIDFFIGSGEISLSQIIARLCGLNREILDWSQRDALQTMINSDGILIQKLQSLADFIFSHHNKLAIISIQEKELGRKLKQEKEEGTSIAALMINSASVSKRLDWLRANLYHFSLLYSFADRELIKNDYFTILSGFLYTDRLYPNLIGQITTSKWNEQINYSMDKVKNFSSSLRAQQIKEFGFPKNLKRYFSIYDKYASPTFESIHLFNSGALRGIQNLLHKTLLSLISLSENGEDFVKQFLAGTKEKNLDKDGQISFLQEIIDTNNLR